MPTKIEKDSVTGHTTTGHEWDGLKELNRPLPKWWLYTMYATIAWAAVWFVLYPSWPGIGGYFQPRALGVGYDVIGDLLHNHLALTAVLALLAVKAVIWIAALGSGTSGGILAPVLMLGAGAGIILSPWLPGGSPSLWALVATSFFMSIMFPTIFALGLEGLGHETEFASSFIVMAICGAAVVPPLMTLFASVTGALHWSMFILAACYAVVVGFGYLAPKLRTA